MEPTIFERRKILDNNSGSPLSRDILEKLRSPKIVSSNKRQIPFGSSVPQVFTSDESIEAFLSCWLRVCNKFEDLTISFAKDPSKYQLDKIQVQMSTKNNPRPWQTKGGIEEVISLIKPQLVRARNVVKITFDASGIIIWTDREKAFSPYRAATAKDVSQYAEEAKKISAERKEKGLPIEEVPGLKSGDMILSENWEPYVEWLPSET